MKLWPRLLAVAVALFLGWRLKEANKEIPFKTASRTNQTWGQYDLKQVRTAELLPRQVPPQLTCRRVNTGFG